MKREWIWLKPALVGLLLLVLFALVGCSTPKEFSNEQHSYQSIIEKMDSMNHSTQTWQQDFLSKQTSLIEKFNQKEKNDSSHTIIINEKGDTIKEKIIIYREVEKDHSVEKEEKEMWMQRFQQIDSLLQVSLDKQAVTDSLLREKERVTEAKLTAWEKVKVSLGGYAIIILIIAIFSIVAFICIKKGILRR